MSDDTTDQVNRFVIALAALLIVFVTAVVILLAWFEPGASIDRIRDFAGWLDDRNTTEAKLIVTLGGIVIALLMMTTLILELTPSPIQRMRVRNIKSGSGTIATTEIADRVNDAIRRLEHVADCEAAVAARGSRVEVVLDLHVDPGADLAQTADAACRRTQELIEQEVGIRLARPPRARLHYRELRLRGESNDSEGPGAARDWERPEGIDEGARERPGHSDTTEEAQV